MRVYISIPSWKSEKALEILRQRVEVVIADAKSLSWIALHA